MLRQLGNSAVRCGARQALLHGAARLPRPQAEVAAVAPAQRQVRWCAGRAVDADSLFASIDEKTFTNFASTQVTLVRPEDGRRVKVIPMSHVASTAFYDSVLNEVADNDCYLVLIEGVLESADDLMREDQLAATIASNPEFREDLRKKVEGNGHYTPEEEAAIVTKTFMDVGMVRERGLQVQELYFKPRLLLQSPLKVANSDVTREMVMKHEDEEERRRFLIHKRTDHCAKVLRGYLDLPVEGNAPPECADAKTIALCWGNEHTSDIIDDLVTRGFVIEREGPVRDYGWDEPLFNDMMQRFEAGGRDLTQILG